MNLKRIVFAAVTAGMLTVTGCAGNTPENNHGNRTGENLGTGMNSSTDGAGNNGARSTRTRSSVWRRSNNGATNRSNNGAGAASNNTKRSNDGAASNKKRTNGGAASNSWNRSSGGVTTNKGTTTDNWNRSNGGATTNSGTTTNNWNRSNGGVTTNNGTTANNWNRSNGGITTNNGTTTNNWNRSNRHYSNGARNDRIYSPDRHNELWDGYSSPAPNVRSNTIGNQLKRYGRTTGYSASMTVAPSAAPRYGVGPKASITGTTKNGAIVNNRALGNYGVK